MGRRELSNVDTFLGRALTDPATGLPNIPYFTLIQQWEERRARRRRTLVRVIRLQLAGGTPTSHRAVLWRLCQEMRTSDLIASDGRDEFRILLTTPDAENVVAIADRVSHVAVTATEAPGSEPPPQADAPALTVRAMIEEPAAHGAPEGPCDPCDGYHLLDPEPPSGDSTPGLGGERR